MTTKFEKFNNHRYNAHASLPSEESFLTDKVYLYKIFKSLKKLLPKESRILEIGCADGSFAKFLMKENYQVLGLDIAEEALHLAQANGVNAQVANIEEGLTITENNFDAVVAAEIIEHLYDTDFFIEEIKKVLKKDGYIFISTPNLASLKNRCKLLFGAYPQYSEYNLAPTSAGHIRNYTIPTLKKQLLDHDFKIIKITSPNLLCPMAKNVPKFLKYLAIWLGDIFPSFGSHIIIVAKK